MKLKIDGVEAAKAAGVGFLLAVWTILAMIIGVVTIAWMAAFGIPGWVVTLFSISLVAALCWPWVLFWLLDRRYKKVKQ